MGPRGDIERVLAVDVGGGTARRADDLHGRSDERLAGVSGDDAAGDGCGLGRQRGGADQREEEQERSAESTSMGALGSQSHGGVVCVSRASPRGAVEDASGAWPAGDSSQEGPSKGPLHGAFVQSQG